MNNLLETICVRITKHCNLNCTHCRAGSSPRTKVYNDIQKIKQTITSFKNIGLKHVSISGGEPSLDVRLFDFIKWLLYEDLYITITTNGTLNLSENLIKNNIEASKHLKIRVSIDGPKHVNDQIRGLSSYEKSLLELQKIKERFFWVGLNTVITEEVYNNIQEFYTEIQPINIDEWALITPVPQGNAEKLNINVEKTIFQINQTYNKIKMWGFEGKIIVWNFLETPNTSIIIDPYGDILLTGINNYDNIKISDIYNLNISQIEKNIQDTVLKKPKTYFKWNQWT